MAVQRAALEAADAAVAAAERAHTSAPAAAAAAAFRAGLCSEFRAQLAKLDDALVGRALHFQGGDAACVYGYTGPL